MKQQLALFLIIILLAISYTGCGSDAADKLAESKEIMEAFGITEPENTGTIDSYKYPLMPEDAQWQEYDVSEHIAILRIPEEILSELTDRALIDALFDYPFLSDLSTADAEGDGIGIREVEQIAGYCDALAELMRRDTARDSLLTYGLEKMNEYAKSSSEEYNAAGKDGAYYCVAQRNYIAIVEALYPEVDVIREPEDWTLKGSLSYEIQAAQSLAQTRIAEPENTGTIASYEYSLTPVDEEWWELSLAARYEAVRIPEEILSELTDQALIDAMFAYPFLIDFKLSDAQQDGIGRSEIEQVAKNCDALAELMRRDTARDSLLTYGLKTVNRYALHAYNSEYMSEAAKREMAYYVDRQEYYIAIVQSLYPEVEIIREPDNLMEQGVFSFQITE